MSRRTEAAATGNRAASTHAGPVPEGQPGGPSNGKREAPSKPAETPPAPNGVLPNKASEDDPRQWGDQPSGYDHDSWLKEQKPPHWD